MKSIIVFLLVIILAGCGTIISRTPGPMQGEKQMIYGGVKTGLSMMSADNDMGVIPALDVPLSITADTLLLPVDLILWWSRYDLEKQK